MFLGIPESKYYGDLPGVTADFERIVKTFNFKRGYWIAYCDKDNQIKVIEKPTNSITNKHTNRLKSRWTETEIFSFNLNIYRNLLNVRGCSFDSLIYVISCHGDTGGIIYDTEGESVPLVTIFDRFNNENCKQLCNKPKIYWVAACRGNRRTKRMKDETFKKHVEKEKHINETEMKPEIQSQTKSQIAGEWSSQQSEDANRVLYDKVKKNSKGRKDTKNTSSKDSKDNSDEKSDSGDQSGGHGITIDNVINDGRDQIGNLYLYSRFNWNRIIYANTDGYGVVETPKGDYTIRCFATACADDAIFNDDFDQIMVQTRKLMPRLMSTSTAAGAEVIDDHNDVPYKMYFAQRIHQ